MESICNLPPNDEQVVSFIEEVKRASGIRSTRTTVHMVRAILNSLREGLNHEQLTALINRLPDPLKGLLIVNWHYPNRPTPRHLDELAERVLYTDRFIQALMRTEIMALRMTLLVLTRLEKYFGMLDIPYPLGLEVTQAVTFEDAA